MKTAFVFSGQGAQYPGMMKDLRDSSPEARRIFETADRVLGRSVSELCFFGTEAELNLTHNTQPCLLTAEIAAFAVRKARGELPCAVAGFSLGEYAALVAAGVLTFEDALRVVQIRADAMQRAVPAGEGAMAAARIADSETAARLCRAAEGYVVCANFNCPGQIVVSGEKKAVKSFCALCKAEGIKATVLPVSAPFHCRLMEPAVAELSRALERVEMRDADLPVYMNVDGRPQRDAEAIRRKILEQTVSPVQWESTVLQMHRDGIDGFVEIGPGDTLTKFVERILHRDVE